MIRSSTNNRDVGRLHCSRPVSLRERATEEPPISKPTLRFGGALVGNGTTDGLVRELVGRELGGAVADEAQGGFEGLEDTSRERPTSKLFARLCPSLRHGFIHGSFHGLFFHDELQRGFQLVDGHSFPTCRKAIPLLPEPQFRFRRQAGEPLDEAQEIPHDVFFQAVSTEMAEQSESCGVAGGDVAMGRQGGLVGRDQPGEGIARALEDLAGIGKVDHFECGEFEAQPTAGELGIEGGRAPRRVGVGQHRKADDPLPVPIPEAIKVGPDPLGKTFVALGLDLDVDEQAFLFPGEQADFHQLVEGACPRCVLRGEAPQFGVEECRGLPPVARRMDEGKAPGEEGLEEQFERDLPRLVVAVVISLLEGHAGGDSTCNLGLAMSKACA